MSDKENFPHPVSRKSSPIRHATSQDLEPTTPIPISESLEEIRRISQKAIASLPGGSVSEEALQILLTGLSTNPNVQGVVLVDLPHSIARPVLEVYALWGEPYSLDNLEEMDEVESLHSDFSSTNENSLPNAYNSWFHITDPRGAPSIGALVESITANYEGTSARIIAGIEYTHGNI